MKELVYHRTFLPAINRFGDKLAIIDGAYRASFREHDGRVFRLCNALKQQLGIHKDHRFAVLAANSHAYVELYHAALLGAGVINPLNLRLSGKRSTTSCAILVQTLFLWTSISLMRFTMHFKPMGAALSGL